MITKDIVQDFNQGDAQGNFKIIVVTYIYIYEISKGILTIIKLFFVTEIKICYIEQVYIESSQGTGS